MITPDSNPRLGQSIHRINLPVTHFITDGMTPYCRLPQHTGRLHLVPPQGYREVPKGSALVDCRGCALWINARPALRGNHHPFLIPDFRWI